MPNLLIFVAVALTVISLVAGIVAMVSHGEVGHYESAHWMNWRVGFQALAVALVLMALQSAR